MPVTLNGRNMETNSKITPKFKLNSKNGQREFQIARFILIKENRPLINIKYEEFNLQLM